MKKEFNFAEAFGNLDEDLGASAAVNGNRGFLRKQNMSWRITFLILARSMDCKGGR